MSTPIETNGTPDLAVECAKWQKRCAELMVERDHLRAELSKVQAERNADLKALHALTQKDFDFTQEEIFAQIGKEPPLEEIVAGLNNLLEKPA